MCIRDRFRVDLGVHFVDRDLGDEGRRGHLVAGLDEPGDDHAGRVGSCRHLRKDHLTHAIASRIAASMRAGVGSTAYSSWLAYGSGTSGTHTRETCLSSSGLRSATDAITSPERPNDW